MKRNTVDEMTFEIARECTQKIVDELHLDPVIYFNKIFDLVSDYMMDVKIGR